MNFIFEWQNNILRTSHADDGVFDDFPKISDHLPKISEEISKLFRRQDERSRTFSENFRRRPEDVSMIHQRI